MEDFELIIKNIADFVWGLPLIILLLGTHLYLTIKLKFVQRFIGKAIKISFGRDKSTKGDISQFGALTIALAATIGTGNIVGVSTAIAAGGPGAVFWMWITGVLGIATKYGEGILAIKYRVKNPDGTYSGGPMYALERGLNKKYLGVIFAIFTIIASLGIGSTVQSNSISHLVLDSYGIPMWQTGLVLSILTALVILGGIKWIANVCSFFVPFMALSYILGCLYILLTNLPSIPGTIGIIFDSAFNGHAAIGGFMGAGIQQAMRMGLARGLFSNESGMGSAPIIAAAAQTKNAVRQALVSASGTFWDTVVICAITGLVIVNSGNWTSGLNGVMLTNSAFAEVPYIGTTILNLGLITFVFSTIIGWSYYAERSIEYLAGNRGIIPFRIFWVIMIMVGSIMSLNIAWNMADIANAMMAIPNLIALLFLSKVIVKETDKYLWSGKIDETDPELE